MKKILILVALSVFSWTLVAQQPTCIMIEYMKVSPDKNAAYWETETFWQKIHQERVKAGDILGWHLWSLKPGDITDGYQFMTVQMFSDPTKMMGGSMNWDKLMTYAKKAYPDMSANDIEKKIMASGQSRLLDKQRFVWIVNGTEQPVEFKKGMIAQLDYMKVDFNSMGAYDAYTKAENDIFKPDHQKMVNDGYKLGWGLGSMMAGVGSDAYATHMTWNFFADWKQYFNQWNYEREEPSSEMQKKMEDGLATRDMRMSILAELQMMTEPVQP